MGFGTGVLISAVAFDLSEQAFTRVETAALTGGLAAGALALLFGDYLVDRRGGERRKRSHGQCTGTSGTVLAVGAVLDGIPESVAIGVSLPGGGSVGIAVRRGGLSLQRVRVALRSHRTSSAGRSRGYILGLWSSATVVSTVAAALGYVLLGDARRRLWQ